jgi:hypothetical protein
MSARGGFISPRYAFILACLADITACNSAKPLDDYAMEHNLYGLKVCNNDLPTVVQEDVLARGCPAGEIANIEGNIQNESKRETGGQEQAVPTQEEAL